MSNNAMVDIEAPPTQQKKSGISVHTFLIFWLPVIVMLGAISVESTEMFGANKTEGMLYPLLNWIALRITGHPINFDFFTRLHMVLRKVGHLSGYGILCALTFRAVRGSARVRALRENSGWQWFWTRGWAGYAFLLTACIAAADELHQAFLPSRTGAFSDVLIDSSGGLIALVIAYLFARWSFQREQSRRIFQAR